MSSFAPSPAVTAGERFRLGLAASRYNPELVDALLAQVLAAWQAAGVKEKNVTVVRVPGSHELPVAIQLLAGSGRLDCLVALGVLVGGDTSHHQLVGASVSHALQAVALAARVPVINGVVVADTPAQARVRCLGRRARGAEFAAAALEMAALKRTLSS